MSMNKCKLKKGDTVVVIAGKDKGKQTEILQVYPQEYKLLLKGVNIVKKHTKPTSTSAGMIAEKELPIHVSNVAYWDAKLAKAVKIGYKIENDKKVRYNKLSNEII